MMTRIAAAILSLATIALLSLWLRGHRVGDATWFTAQRWHGRELSREQLGVWTGAGRFVVTFDLMKTRIDDDWEFGEWKKLYVTERRIRHGTIARAHIPGEHLVYFMGIGGQRLTLPSGRRAWSISVPIWMLAIVTAIWPVLRLRQSFRRWSRSRRGLCEACGYDLRASGAKCPECGAANSRMLDPVV